MHSDNIMLSIIVPCYNEYSRFPLDAFDNFIFKSVDLKFCFVNDGSSDDTAKLLNDLGSKHKNSVVVLHLPNNRGKGNAVRHGINYMLKNNSSKYLCYLDADLSTPLSEVSRIFKLMIKHNELLCVFGSRVSVFGSQISRLSYRHYGGRIIATLIDMILKLSIYDTQCGLKIFRNTLAEEIFRDPFLSRWLFDVEIFAKMKMVYPLQELKSIMKEIPLEEWNEMGNSKIRFIDLIKIPFSLLSINNKYQTSYSRSKNMILSSERISSR